jgi:hypothetical protein
MPLPHLMQEAVRVREKCSAHRSIMHECSSCLEKVSMIYTCGSPATRYSTIPDTL